MARLSHKEKYINTLLKLNKDITSRITTEIDEVFHDRGRSSSEVEATIQELVREAFANGTRYKEEPEPQAEGMQP